MENNLFDIVEIINDDLKDSHDVIKYVENIFINNKWCDDQYFKFVEKDNSDNESYMVIAPHIVLLHSAPEHGALENRYYLGLLEKPVYFNHPSNDPVKIVIAFTAVDNNQHIQSIQKLALMLMKDNFVATLSEAESSIDLNRKFLQLLNE